MSDRERLIALYNKLEEEGLIVIAGKAVAAELMIANGVTVQKWIPVTERLPEETDGHVLVTDGDVVKISCRNAMYRTRGGDIRCAQNYGAGMCVTHWMPLPEPPKGE